MKMGGTNWRDFFAFFPTVHVFFDVQQKEVVAKQEKMLMWNCEFNLESLSESRQKDHNVSPIFTIGKFTFNQKIFPWAYYAKKFTQAKIVAFLVR